VGHYSIYIPDVAQLLPPIAKTGVWLFFILSSFLLTRQMILALATPPLVEKTARYFVRRALRILPLYYTTLALLLILPEFANNMFGGRGFSLSKHAFLLYPEGIFWAISVEFEYYIAIPILALIFLKLRSVNRFFGPLLGIGLVVLAAQAYIISWIMIGFPVNYPHVTNYAHFFLLGSALAIFFLYRSLLPASADSVASLLFCFGILLQAFILPYSFRDAALDSIGFPIEWWHWLAQHPGQMISCSAIVMGVLYSKRIGRFFSNRLLRFFGKISFSLYCLHILPAAYFGHWTVPLTPLGATCAFFALSVVLSLFTFSYIERPCMNLIRGPEQAGASLNETSITAPRENHIVDATV
jgi:peptidoglycan/LPS O-acetylase OafA/YrhL